MNKGKVYFIYFLYIYIIIYKYNYTYIIIYIYINNIHFYYIYIYIHIYICICIYAGIYKLIVQFDCFGTGALAHFPKHLIFLALIQEKIRINTQKKQMELLVSGINMVCAKQKNAFSWYLFKVSKLLLKMDSLAPQKPPVPAFSHIKVELISP